MSVINKMLQDLDKRQHTGSNSSSDSIDNERTEFVKPQLQYQQVISKPKPYKALLLIAVILVAMVWFGTHLLQQANSESKGRNPSHPELISQVSQTVANDKPITVTAHQQSESKTQTKLTEPKLNQAKELEAKLIEPKLAPPAVIKSLQQVAAPVVNQVTANQVAEHQSSELTAVSNTKKLQSQTAAITAHVDTKAAQSHALELASQSPVIKAANGQTASINDDTSSSQVTSQATVSVTPVTDSTASNVGTSLSSSTELNSPQSTSLVKVSSAPSKPLTTDVATTSATAPQSQSKAVTQTADMQVTEVKLTKQQLAQREFNQGVSAEQNRNIEQAVSHYLQAILLQPDFHQARKSLAGAYYLQQNPLTAVRVLESGVTMFPKQFEFYLLMANYLTKMGDYDKALTKLKNIDNSSDWARDKWIAQTEIAQQSTRPKLAEQAYRELVRLEPQQARWWMGLAYALDTQTQYSKAAQAYRSALDNNGLSNAAMQFIENRLEQLGTNR